MAKLTKLQQELLDAMKGGVEALFMPYRGRFGDAYYYRSDNGRKCTRQATALIDKGLVRRVSKRGSLCNEHRLIYKD